MEHISQHFPTVLAGLAVLLVSRAAYLRFFHPLSHVPGPFLASLTSAWLAYAYWRQDWHRYSIKLHKRYGPVVRIGPNALDIGDVNAVRVIYGTGSKFWKGNWYTHLKVAQRGETLLAMTDAVRHKEIRRLLDPLYTMKTLRESEVLFDDSITFFVEQMRARNGQVVDLADWMVVFAVDAFTAMTYGKRYGLLEQGRAPEMNDFVDGNWMPYTAGITLSPFMGWLMKWRQALMILLKVVLNGGKPPLPILGWVGKQVEAGIAAASQKGGLSDVPTLLERTAKVHRDHPSAFGEQNIGAHMFEIVFAGFETCGATLPKIMHYVASTEGCQEQLREELESVKQTSGLDGLTTYDVLCRLPYLDACIKESFRINPITGIPLSRTVPSGGVKISGFNIPAGTELGITPWVTSFDEQLMPEPDKFRPERWIEASSDDRKLMERSDLFFGAGPSGCLGKVLALGLLYKVIAVVFSNFRVEVIDTTEEIVEQNTFPVKWRNAKMKLHAL